MTDPELRDYAPQAPVFSRTEPLAPAIPARPAAVSETPAPSRVFAADGFDGEDALGVGALTSLIAELVTHQQAELPFCVGFLGGAGSGKSFALSKLATAIESLSGKLKAAPGAASASDIAIVKADAAQLDGEPLAALAGALCTGLDRYAPALVEEALRAVRDPHAAVTEAAERLDQAQRRFSVERESLTEVEGRRARLFETLLYEMPGSQVDAYVRTYRPRIASRLQAFGIPGDPVIAYKDYVASLAAVRGPGGRIALALRTLWAFKGQTRLLVMAVMLALVGMGLDWAVAHQASWLPALRGNPTGAPVADWLAAHMDAFASAAKIAFIAAGLAVLANLWRAFRFLQPILRGITLLRTEFANRRQELDSAYAHQTRRVDGLAAEVERAARLHAEADKHAGSAGQQLSLRAASPFKGNSAATQALDFAATLATLIGKPAGHAAPRRIVVMLDNLDSVAPARACEIVEAAHRLLAHPAFVTVIGVDPYRLGEAGHTAARLEKWVQVPVRIDAIVKDHAGFIAHLIGQSGQGELRSEKAVAVQAGSGLDQPISEIEGSLLTALAPLAGRSARALKRFVNLYRLTRPLVPDHWASLAFLLALQNGGSQNEMEALANALAVAKPGADLDFSQDHPRLNEALAAVRSVETGSTSEAAKRAAPVAAIFSFGI